MADKMLLDVAEVAELLGVSQMSIRRYFRDGKLKAFRIGRLLKFKRSEVEEFIENSRG
jgi:excisionase family DNA binding protein